MKIRDNIQHLSMLHDVVQNFHHLFRNGDFMKHSTLDRRSKYSIHVIREALFELLRQKPLDEITVVEICKTADVNRGTFYKYYRDVPDLYDQTENALVEEFHALLPNMEKTDYDLPLCFKDILKILVNNREFIYIAKNKPFSERLAQKLLVFFEPYLQETLRSSHPESKDSDIIFLTEYILGGLTRIVTYWVNTEMKLSTDEMEKILTDIMRQSMQIHLDFNQ